MSQIFLSPFAMPELDRVVEQLCAPSSLEGVFPRPLHDAPMLKHHDCVGVAHGGEPVRNHKDRAAAHEGVHPSCDKRLGSGVHARGGLV